MRRILLILILSLFFVGGYAGEPRRPILGRATPIQVIPVALDSENPNRRILGPLEYLGGWQLKSDDPAFGSFSAMIAQGDALTLLSDAGGIVRLTLKNGHADSVQFADLASGPGGNWTKKDRDAEAMTRNLISGEIWIGFERHNAVWRYSPDLRRAEAQAEPKAMAKWPSNGGPEAMVRLENGHFLIFGESKKKGLSPILLYDRDPTDPAARSMLFQYRPPEDYKVTDAVELPDGRILVLHRRIALDEYLRASLTIVDPRQFQPGKIIVGAPAATFAAPLITDNMEAISITQENGQPILWMASDDNFDPVLQRTLLLKFRLRI